MSKVADVLVHKKADVLTINANETVFAAISKMVDRNVGSILVTDGPEILGIFTERDYLRRVVLQNRTSRTTLVSEIMSRGLITTDSDRSVLECMNIMTNKRIRYLPVIENGQLTGIVSIGDLVKHLCDERSVEVKNLTDYITGRYPGSGSRFMVKSTTETCDKKIESSDIKDFVNEGGRASPDDSTRDKNVVERSDRPLSVDPTDLTTAKQFEEARATHRH